VATARETDLDPASTGECGTQVHLGRAGLLELDHRLTSSPRRTRGQVQGRRRGTQSSSVAPRDARTVPIGLRYVSPVPSSPPLSLPAKRSPTAAPSGVR